MKALGRGLLMIFLVVLIGCEEGGSGGARNVGDDQLSVEQEKAVHKCLEDKLGWTESGEVVRADFFAALRSDLGLCEAQPEQIKKYVELVENNHPQIFNDYLN